MPLTRGYVDPRMVRVRRRRHRDIPQTDFLRFGGGFGVCFVGFLGMFGGGGEGRFLRVLRLQGCDVGASETGLSRFWQFCECFVGSFVGLCGAHFLRVFAILIRLLMAC